MARYAELQISGADVAATQMWKAQPTKRRAW